MRRARLFWANVAFVFTAVLLFTAYILISNGIVSYNVAAAGKRSDLGALSAKVATLESTIARGQDFTNLVSLAQRKGMVVRKDADTLLVSSRVALSDAQDPKKQDN